jgi:hypothetical protein
MSQCIELEKEVLDLHIQTCYAEYAHIFPNINISDADDKTEGAKVHFMALSSIYAH